MATPNSPTGNAVARILVVDDHPHAAATLGRAMSQLEPKLDILTAESGERALELVRDKSVDLVITDLVMPGMTGLELIEKLQGHPGGRPAYTMLITAYDIPGLKETARRLKVNDVVIKPIRPERVCQLVAKAIEGLGDVPVPQALETKPQPKILVADDQPENVILLSRYLGNEGYSCITASDGNRALEVTRTEMPDLILLDVNMPVKDGFETLQEIRSDPAINHIPVIILTAARLEPMDMQYALSIGADDYITKPFDRRELLARIRTRLRVKEAEDVIRRQNKQLSLLPEIGRELSARLDVDELIDLVLRRTVETLGALLGHIILLAPEGAFHKSYRISTTSFPVHEVTLPPIEALAFKLKNTRQGFIIDDIHKDKHWRVATDDPTRTVVVVPLLGRHEILGLLVLAHEQRGYFTLEHKLLLQAIASQASIAIENARFYASTTQGQKRENPVFEHPIQAAILFDENGQVKWLSPTGEELFGTPPVSPGESLPTGKEYNPLIGLLEYVRTSGKTTCGEITWPDGLTFVVSIAPMANGDCLALFYAAMQPCSENFAS
jgi:CheY-like chemotaxis protein